MKKLMNILLIIIVIAAVVGGVYFVINNKGTEEPKTEKKVENRVEETKSYSIENKKVYLFEENENNVEEEYRGFSLLEYKDTNDYAEIYYILYDYTTDPSFYYSLKVTDESENNLLLNKKEEQITGGIISTVKIRKVSLDSKINFEVFEKESNKINNSTKLELDLSKDLVGIEKIKQTENLKDGKIGNVEFKYIDDEYVYFGTTEHAYSKKLVGEAFSLPVKVQYGNKLVSQEHIEINCEKNVNNLSLEQAFESLSLIDETFGQYGLSDIYGMNILDKKGEEVIGEVILTFDQVMKLCAGEKIEVDGKEYTKETFNEFAHIKMLKDEDVVIGDGIKTIKYHFDNGDVYNYYMFIDEENIYYVKVPMEERISEETEEFLKSLKFNNN